MIGGPNNNAIALDDALRLRIDACARVTGVSAEEFVRVAVETYLQAHGSNGSSESPKRRSRLADLAAAAGAGVPAEEWDKVPRDLAQNFEHHRYGYPREE